MNYTRLNRKDIMRYECVMSLDDRMAIDAYFERYNDDLPIVDSIINMWEKKLKAYATS